MVAALVHRPGSLVRPGHGGGDRAGPGPPRRSRPRAIWTARTSWKPWEAQEQAQAGGGLPAATERRRPPHLLDAETAHGRHRVSDAQKPAPVRAAASNRKNTPDPTAAEPPGALVRGADYYAQGR